MAPIAALAALPGGHVRAEDKAERPRVTIALASRASLQYLPLVLAGNLGFFQAEGVDVELREFGGPAQALAAAREGHADMLGEAFGQTIPMQSRNQFFRAFVLLGRAPQIALGVSSKALPRLRSIAELKGRRIGVAAGGSAADTTVQLVLLRAGLSLDAVTWVALPTAAAALTAVRAGEVDAISHSEPVMTMLEHRADVRIVADTRTLKGTQDVYGGPMPTACLMASDEFLQKNRQAAQAVANAVIHTLKWLQTAGPSDLVKVVPEPFLMGDRGLYVAAFNKSRETIAVDGLIAEEGVRTAMRVQSRLQQQLRPEQITLARTFTNVFAQKAKEKYQA